MVWSKRGVVLPAPTHLAWARSHAALPIVDPLGGTRALVYFSSRDERNRAQIGRAVVDLDSKVLSPEFEPEPMIRLGPSGAFDESGVTGGCLVRSGGTQHLYYSGWSLPGDLPFLFFIGCAASTDGRTFEKVSSEPVLGRSSVDRFVTASPSILIDIGYAESNDGLDWSRHDDLAGITVSSEGWDSEMVCYPWVGDLGGSRRMLYNGNAYGRTGIGQAVLEDARA